MTRSDHHAEPAGELSRRAFLSGAAALPAAMAVERLVRHTGGALALGARGRTWGRAPCDDLTHDAVLRMWRGYRADRSGQVLFVPKGFNYLDGGISHSTPWPYTQDVPMLWYGPGFINARRYGVSRYVTLADIAPTVAKLMGFPFDAKDGRAMTEALDPDRAGKPKLIVVLVWDAGGRYVLDLFPRHWPRLKDLRRNGTWYANATVGSSPSNTAPAHATIGTGAFPRRHGVVDNTIRFPDGKLLDPWARGPGVLRVNALADEYGKAMGSKAAIGMFGTLPWHLAMVGKGTLFPGGHRSFGVLRSRDNSDTEAPIWMLPDSLQQYYRFPGAYLNETSIDPFLYVADQADGKADGKWRGKDIRSLQGGFHTPARVPFQTHGIKEVVKHEHLGQHQATDLLFLNYKIIDEVGHEYFASSPEMGDTIRVQDHYLQDLVDFLDERLPQQWVLCLTADHGHTAEPSRTGGVAISEGRVGALVDSRFDRDGSPGDLVQITRPVWLNLDPAEITRSDLDLRDVAAYMRSLTKAQTAGVSGDHAGDRVFRSAFPGSALSNLPCLG